MQLKKSKFFLTIFSFFALFLFLSMTFNQQLSAQWAEIGKQLGKSFLEGEVIEKAEEVVEKTVEVVEPYVKEAADIVWENTKEQLERNPCAFDIEGSGWCGD